MVLILRFAAVLAAAALLLVLAVRLLEDHIVFVPSRGSPPPPPGWGIEEVPFASADGTRLHGWYAPAAPGKGTLLWCHGNAGNLGDRADDLVMILERGLGVFLFDYRGYGRSEGRPSEEGLYADAAAALDAMERLLGPAPEARPRRPDPRRAAGEPRVPIVVLGRSLGAAVAVDLALRRPAAGLILEGSFPSAPALGRTMYPFLPLGFLMRIRLDAASRIEHLRCPVLFFHGDADSIVPIVMGRELFDRAPEPKRFVTIRGAGHNDLPWIGGAAYLDALEAFVDRCRRAWHPSPREEGGG